MVSKCSCIEYPTGVLCPFCMEQAYKREVDTGEKYERRSCIDCGRELTHMEHMLARTVCIRCVQDRMYEERHPEAPKRRIKRLAIGTEVTVTWSGRTYEGVIRESRQQPNRIRYEVAIVDDKGIEHIVDGNSRTVKPKQK